MNEMKGRVFLKIIQKHGLCKKEDACKYIGLIRDNFAGWKLERNLLLLSLRANIYTELISDIKLDLTSNSFPQIFDYYPVLLKFKFIEKLKTNFWLTQEASEWLIETWINAILDSLDTKEFLNSQNCTGIANSILVVNDSLIEKEFFNIPLILNQPETSESIDKLSTKIQSNTGKFELKKTILDKAICERVICDIPITDTISFGKNSEIVFNNNPCNFPKILSPAILTETKLEVLNPKTVRIPAGTFAMGSPKSEFGRAEDETLHNVTITQDFLLCVNPVTQELWRSVMGYDSNKIEEENLPITNISWNDVQDFIKKFNILTDKIYRLPTEAEWEYACRAGTDTAYSFSGSINEDNANYKNKTFPMLKPVCSCFPNAFGLYDMHGNVWEWCEDWYGIYISTFQWLTNFSRTPLKDPYGPIKGEKRVIRGGSFNSLPKDLRSSCRSKLLPSDKYNSVGFRLVKEI